MRILHGPISSACQPEGWVWNMAALSSTADMLGVLGTLGGGLVLVSGTSRLHLLMSLVSLSVESKKSILSFRFLPIRIVFPVDFYDNTVNVFFGNNTDSKMLKWLWKYYE